MSKENGFLQLRRGVFKHVRDGYLNLLQAFCFIYMLTQADTRNGIWIGGAGALAGELSIPSRTARHVLEALDGRYIKRFAVPGRKGCYPILFHKFLITDGEHRGEQLNALGSVSPVDLRYFPRQQEGEHHVEHVATQKRIETREQKNKKNHAARAAPPADQRFKLFYDFAYEAYRTRNGQPPTWGGKDRKNLKQFLAEQSHVTPEEWQRRYWTFLDSADHFIRNRAGSLAYFVTNFDVFKDGPIPERCSEGPFIGPTTKNRSAAIHAEAGKYDSTPIQRLTNQRKLLAV